MSAWSAKTTTWVGCTEWPCSTFARMWLDMPRHYPHKCHSCHRGNVEAGPFFEHGLQYRVWEEGDNRNYSLYTCATCVRAIISAPGCPMNINVLQEEVETLVGDANAMREELIRVQAERDQIAHELATLMAEPKSIGDQVVEYLQAQQKIGYGTSYGTTTTTGTTNVTYSGHASSNLPRKRPPPKKKP
jgi:hypothetical protein